MAREVFNLMFTTRTTSTIMMFGNTVCHEKLDKQQNICVRHVFVVIHSTCTFATRQKEN